MQVPLTAAMIAGSLLAGPVLALVSAPPAGDGIVLVLAPPWADRGTIIEASGGAPVGLADAPLGTLAASPAPDFAEKLRARGAWLVIDGRPLAAICGI